MQWFWNSLDGAQHHYSYWNCFANVLLCLRYDIFTVERRRYVHRINLIKPFLSVSFNVTVMWPHSKTSSIYLQLLKVMIRLAVQCTIYIQYSEFNAVHETEWYSVSAYDKLIKSSRNRLKQRNSNINSNGTTNIT